MALPQVGAAAYPTVTELRDGILRDLLYYGLKNGLTFNVLPGSEHYILATILANRIAIAIANNKISNEQRNPLTSTGTALEDFCRAYGITKRPASPSTGFIEAVVSSGSVVIPTTYQATAPNGKKYVPVTSGTYVNGDSVEMTSVASGEDTEQDAGAVLTWDSASIANLKSSAVVDGAGITGGTDGDTDEDLRRRLIDRLSQQAIGGNGASVKGWAEEVSASIWAAFVYQAAQGGSTYAFAIGKDFGDRTLTPSVVSLAAANVNAKMPGGVVQLNATTFFPERVDVVLSATLPLPATSGGTGGGWRDATPWPAEITKITNVSGDGVITVDSTTSPVVGQHIGVWDNAAAAAAADEDEAADAMLEFDIITVGGGVGAWEITVVGSTAALREDMYVSAGAVNLKRYAATWLMAMNELGPGEKVSASNTDLMPRAARYPGPDVTAPYALTSIQIAAVTNAHSEVQNLTYAARYATETTDTLTSPTVPPTTADPPRILVLKHFAIIKA